MISAIKEAIYRSNNSVLFSLAKIDFAFSITTEGTRLLSTIIRSAQQNTTDGIDERLQELQKELLKKANNKEVYDEIADEIFKLWEQREKCTVDTAARTHRLHASTSYRIL